MNPFARLLHLGAAFIIFLAPFANASAATLPPGFSEQNLGSGWNEPVGLAFDPSPQGQDRIYVWERSGRVWLVENGVKAATPLLDLSAEVGGWRDYGLLGLTLHPNFQQNGYIYLFYVVDRHHLLHAGTPGYDPAANEYFAATIGRLTRYTARAEDGFRSIDPASRHILLGETISAGLPILHLSHGTGQLRFGADGTLLASCGDGASYQDFDDGGAAGNSYAVQGLADGIIRSKENVGAFRAQLVDSLSGKILRLDPQTGDGVPGNPFYDPAQPRAAKSRVWALGLRNPYRFTFRPGTGSHHVEDANPGVIVLGDVGYSTWEDIHVIDGAGQNAGWPIFEGLTANIHYREEYPATNLDAPNPLGGFFAFRDLIVQETLAQPSWPNPRAPTQQIPASIPRFMHRRPVIDMGRSITPVGPARTGIFLGDIAEVIEIGASGSPVAGAQFAGNASTGGFFYEGNDFPASYRGTYFHADYGKGWIKHIDFDASHRPVQVYDFALQARVVFLATHPTQGGLYYIERGGGNVRKVTYSPSGNLPPVAVAAASGQVGAAPLKVTFSSTGSQDPEGQPLSFLWEFGDGATSTMESPTHTFITVGTQRFDVKLTLTDNAGATAQTTVPIFVNHTLPAVTLLSPVDGTKYLLSGETQYALTRRVVEAPGHPTTTQWEVLLHHNEHEHGETPVIAPEAVASISPVFSTTEDYFYRVLLTVTDDLGAVVRREARLFPNNTNVAPQLAWSVPQQTRAASSAAQLLDPTASATDADSPGIETGELRLVLTGGAMGDRLSIVPEDGNAGLVQLAGSSVIYDRAVVGEFSSGAGSQPLLVRFNDAATPSAAQAILRRIAATFASLGPRSVSATLSDGDGATSAATPLNVEVSGSPNQPPRVAVTSPTAGTVLIAPANIRIIADASDPDGNVAQVEFFQGSTKLGEDHVAPFGFTWSAVAAGTYALTAQATDELGAVTISPAATITVTAPANQLPVVALTQPAPNTRIAGPALLTLAAEASDPDGNVAKVEFFAGPDKVGEDTSAPFAVTWGGASAGVYVLTARATDNRGGTKISTPRSVVISGSRLPASWKSQDIGAVGAPGRSSSLNGRFTLLAGGRDLAASADQLHFLWQSWTGDGEITVRVRSVQAITLRSLGGITFRESFAPGAAHVLLGVTASSGSVFQSRAAEDAAATKLAGPGVHAPQWLKLVRSGAQFSGYTSVNGRTWSLAGTAQVPMSQTSYVGLAASASLPTDGDPSTQAAATFTHLAGPRAPR